MNANDQEQVRLLIAAAARGNWLKESILASVVMAGAAFVVHSYIPDAIKGETASIASDVSSAKADIGNLKTAVTNIQTDVSGIRNDVKDILKDALKGAYKKVVQASPSGDQRERRAGLQAGSEAIALAQGLTAIGVKLDVDEVTKFGLAATRLVGNPNLSDDAWRVTTQTVNYTSANAEHSVDWIGPIEPYENGFKGLFGITEMAGVRMFASKNRVPFSRSSVVLTFVGESRVLRNL
jgi:hypothetical protein